MRSSAVLRAGVLLGSGFLLGAVAMDSLAIRARPFEREAVRTSALIHNEFRAGREARDGNLLKSLVHRWNLVLLYDGQGEEVLGRPEWNEERFLPIRLLLFRAYLDHRFDREKSERGAEILQALARQKLAATLVGVGHPEEAEAQLAWAEPVIARCSKTPAASPTLAQILEEESTELHQEAERAVLGH